MTKEIPGFDGYSVSDSGVVFGRTGIPIKFSVRKGYRRVNLYVGGKRITLHVSVAVLTTFVGPRPDGKEAAHWDGVKTNNTVGNLRWATHAENCQDQVRHGTSYVASHRGRPETSGEFHPPAKLTQKQVDAIRSLPREYGMFARIGRELGVSEGTISAIYRGLKWKNGSRPGKQGIR